MPVINGLTKLSHPCQIMADLLTFEEHRGSIAGKSVAWTGDSNNVLLHPGSMPHRGSTSNCASPRRANWPRPRT